MIHYFSREKSARNTSLNGKGLFLINFPFYCAITEFMAWFYNYSYCSQSRNIFRVSGDFDAY